MPGSLVPCERVETALWRGRWAGEREPGGEGDGELSRRAGIPASAIRYYEGIGLLGKAPRSGGRRWYTRAGVSRLAFIAFAREVGFTLREIRELIGGFPASRWRPLAQRKLVELDRMSRRIRWMRSTLGAALRCDCLDVEACGETLLARSTAGARPETVSRWRRVSSRS